MTLNQGILVVFALLNLWTFAVYGVDKRRASKNKPRISEAQLLLWAAAGGAVGAWLGVRVFRHKTRKTTFLFPLGVASVLGGLVCFAVYQLLWQHDVPTA